MPGIEIATQENTRSGIQEPGISSKNVIASVGNIGGVNTMPIIIEFDFSALVAAVLECFCLKNSQSFRLLAV